MTFVFMLIFCFCLIVPANAQTTAAPEQPAIEEKTAQQPAVPETAAPTGNVPAAQQAPAVEEQQQKPSELTLLLEKMKNRERPSLSFKLNFTQNKENKELTYYKKGDKYRLETSVYDGSLKNLSKVVIMSDGKESFIYMPSVHVATKGSIPEMNFLDDLLNKDLSVFEVKGQQTVNGYPCRVLVTPDDSAEICFSEQFLMPVTFRGGPEKAVFSNISEKVLDDNLFVLPTDVYIF